MKKKKLVHISNPFKIIKDWKRFPSEGKYIFIGIVAFMIGVATLSYIFKW